VLYDTAVLAYILYQHYGCIEYDLQSSDQEPEEEVTINDEKMFKIFNLLRHTAWDIYKDNRRNYYGYAEDDPDQADWLQAKFTAEFKLLDMLDTLNGKDENAGVDFNIYQVKYFAVQDVWKKKRAFELEEANKAKLQEEKHDDAKSQAQSSNHAAEKVEDDGKSRVSETASKANTVAGKTAVKENEKSEA
jgi:hypothetical protein